MNIGINANVLLFEKAGVGKYTQNIITELLKKDRKNHYFLYFSYLRHKKKREKQIKSLLPQTKNYTIKVFPLPAAWYEYLFSLPLPITRLITDKIDVFFAPYASGIPKNGFPKMVVMIHDLVFMKFPEHRGRKLSNYYLKRHMIALKNCKKVIVPSETTKKDLQKLLNISPHRVKVIAEAASSDYCLKSDKSEINKAVKNYFDPKTKYILSVGTLEPRKNLSKLIEAYALLPHALKKDHRLVLTGGRGWNNTELDRKITNLNLRDKLILTGFVANEDLAYIYNKASVFVYPSLYEGFGLPPLEAMACGVPVIASNNSSLKEVVGNAGILVNPQNEVKISGAIKKVLMSRKVSQNLTKRGLIKSKKYSWKKAARETLKVFEDLNK